MSREEAYEQAAVCYRRAGYDLEAARCYRLAGAHRRAAEIYEAAGRYAEGAAAFADAGLPEFGAWLLAHWAGQPAQARVILGAPAGESSQDAQPPRDPGPVLTVRVNESDDSLTALEDGVEYSIGRDPYADFTVQDPRVSWRHATVRQAGGSWVFEDARGTSGSWVNGQRMRRIELGQDPEIRLASPDDGPALQFTTHARGAFIRPLRPQALRRRIVLARCEIADGEPAGIIRPVISDVCAVLADSNLGSDQVTEEWAVALSETAARYDQAALVFAAALRGGRYGAAQRWQAWSRRVLDAEIILPPAPAVSPTMAA